MTSAGYGALALASFLSLYIAVASILGAARKSQKLLKRARKAIVGLVGLVTLASAILIYLLVTRDFQVEYVYKHVSSYQPTIYNFSAFWAGQEGSLLLWLWLLTIFSFAIARRKDDATQELKPYALAVLALCQLFNGLLLLFVSNPFATYATAPLEGRGLNPLLENLWMVIHPPVVFVGYAAYTVPFAFAIAALITGKLDKKWMQSIRRWNLFAWLFLGMGIILGAWWAYVELGWGGYWGWDPVENSSLVPWLVGTALLHSATMQEQRGIFKIWNIALVTLTFVLCIFATFVTRSGIIQSVHAFGESAIGYYFLAFMVVALAIPFVLTLRRRRELAAEREMESLLSRESGFLLNNLLLCGMAVAILAGTMYPAITEFVQGTQVALGTSFFERVSAPLGLALVLLIGVCPVLRWRQTSGGQLLRGLRYPGIIALALAALMFALGIRAIPALLAFTVCAFVAAAAIWEFLRDTAARRRSTGEDFLLAFRRLVVRNRRRYGGYIVHLSIVLITVGLVGSSLYGSEYEITLAAGERAVIGDYTLEYAGPVTEHTPAKHRFAAPLGIYRGQRRITTLVPEKNLHWNIEQWVTEVAVRSSFKEDLYVILAGVAQDGSASLHIMITPLVIWLWIGGGLLLLGTTVAIWPQRKAESRTQ